MQSAAMGTTLAGWAMIFVFVALCVAMAKPFGMWLFALYEGRAGALTRVLGPVERGLFRVTGIDARQEQTWLG